MFAVVWVDPEYVGWTLAVLWGVVLIGGVGGLALTDSNPNGGAGDLGRLMLSAAVFAFFPALTLSCSAAFG